MIVYLDYNATAPLRPGVQEVVALALLGGGNASSVHSIGRRARRIVEDARAAVAALVGAQPEQVTFTGSGSEANNQALAMAAGGVVLTSTIEHDSVLMAAPDAVRMPVAGDGLLDLTAAADLLEQHRPALASVMLVNNETGVIQPVAEVAELASRQGALVHCDGVQAVGRIDVDMDRFGIDLLTLSAHKLGGPQGVGALVARAGFEPSPLIRGGGQERRRRAGTENVAGIAGFGKAAEVVRDVQDEERHRVEALRDHLEATLAELVPETVVLGRDAPRVGNTSCLALPGRPAETLLIALDLEGICVSAGAACSSGKVATSHVLTAMGVGDDLRECAIRVSLGHGSRPADVDRLVDVWSRFAARTSERGRVRRTA
jgi:cysteine desulfurase